MLRLSSGSCCISVIRLTSEVCSACGNCSAQWHFCCPDIRCSRNGHMPACFSTSLLPRLHTLRPVMASSGTSDQSSRSVHSSRRGTCDRGVGGSPRQLRELGSNNIGPELLAVPVPQSRPASWARRDQR